MQDLRAIDVDVVTFGQYLRPTEKHLSVVEYVKPEKFDYFRQVGEEMGFKYVASGPMVRSSYKAGEFYLEHMIKTERKQREQSQRKKLFETMTTTQFLKLAEQNQLNLRNLPDLYKCSRRFVASRGA